MQLNRGNLNSSAVLLEGQEQFNSVGNVWWQMNTTLKQSIIIFKPQTSLKALKQLFVCVCEGV